MTELATNVPYYGDNLDLLRRYLPDASVDLINSTPARDPERPGLPDVPKPASPY